jgi:hypothetical protein
MRGRNRGKGHHGGHHHNPLTRVYESNGPDVKIRGTAHHIAEKYLQLARDAQSSGDPVTAENHYQHAEHYFRLIAAAQEQFRQQNPYYQAQPPAGDGARDDAMEGEEDDGQPAVIQQNLGGQPATNGAQPGYHNPEPYPPNERAQSYGAPPQNYQSRPQQPPQYQPSQSSAPLNDGDRLPSFITGAPPMPSSQGLGTNGYEGDGGGERFPRHRRRRHRGGQRPGGPGGSQDFRDDGPEPSNS